MCLFPHSERERKRADLEIVGACLAVECEGVLCGRAVLAVEQVGADHDACATLSGLAVDERDVRRVVLEPGVEIGAKRRHQHKGRRMVIVKGICGHCRQKDKV